MLRILVGLMNNLRIRSQQIRARILLGFRLLRNIDRRVRRVLLYDVTISVTAILLSWLFESNIPARIAWLPILVCWYQFNRPTSINIWLGELGITLLDRGVSTIETWWDDLRRRVPWPVYWIIGRPQTPPHPEAHRPVATLSGAHHDENASQVWSDVSVGGHVFHIISTAWMWMHLPVYLAGWLPVWKTEVLTSILMFTGVVVFFVATEEFVRIKVWRARYGMFVALHFLIVFSSWIFQMALPGTYDDLVSQIGWYDTIKETTAVSRDRQLLDERERAGRLSEENRLLDIRYQQHLNHGGDGHYDSLAECLAYSDCWEPNDSRKYESNIQRLNALDSGSSGEDRATAAQDWIMDHLILTVILIGGLVLLLPDPKKKTVTASSSH